MSDKIQRPRFFEHQLLSPADLTAEQECHLQRARRINRTLIVPGIVYGLQLSKDDSAVAVHISPGLAIDRLGREVILFQPTLLDAEFIEQQGAGLSRLPSCYVYLQYREMPNDLRTGPDGKQYRRLEESAQIILRAQLAGNEQDKDEPVNAADAAHAELPSDTDTLIFLGDVKLGADGAESVPDSTRAVRRCAGLRVHAVHPPAGDQSRPFLVHSGIEVRGENTKIQRLLANGAATFLSDVDVDGGLNVQKSSNVKEHLNVGDVKEIDPEEVPALNETEKEELMKREFLHVGHEAFFDNKVYLRTKDKDDNDIWMDIQDYVSSALTKLVLKRINVELKAVLPGMVANSLPEVVVGETVLSGPYDQGEHTVKFTVNSKLESVSVKISAGIRGMNISHTGGDWKLDFEQVGVPATANDKDFEFTYKLTLESSDAAVSLSGLKLAYTAVFERKNPI